MKGDMEVPVLSQRELEQSKVRRARARQASICGDASEHEVSLFSPASADAFVDRPANMCGDTGYED